LLKDDDLRGVSRCDRKGCSASLKRGNALLQHRLGRVSDPCIDVAERLQPEQGGGVVGVVKHE
jgi:hypothetical protein